MVVLISPSLWSNKKTKVSIADRIRSEGTTVPKGSYCLLFRWKPFLSDETELKLSYDVIDFYLEDRQIPIESA